MYQPKYRKPRKRILPILLTLLILALLTAAGFALKLRMDRKEPRPEIPETTLAQIAQTETTEVPTQPETEPTEPEPTLPQPEHAVSAVTIGAMGDLLMHKPIFDSVSACYQGGSYDFSSVFQYLTPYTSALDYAVANLETTLCGTDNGYKYSGYPSFNCPDEIVDGARDAGFDMLLTANNHSYDTRMVGFKRTVRTVRERGLAALGSMESADEPKWVIQEVGGIRIGMIAYTYATSEASGGRPSLNVNPYMEEGGLCNYFCTDKLSAFYSKMETQLAEMREAGAEAIVLYIHWGDEYSLSVNKTQKAMAQKLCDMGVDVIVGGHPHVVEPMAMLTGSEDPDKKTLCIYSLGNAVSNQRSVNITVLKTAHTEDGVLFTFTFEKYSDGTVYLAGTDVVPTWVNKHKNSDGEMEFNILPLVIEQEAQWAQNFGIGSSTVSAAKQSYDRTMDILGDGLQEAQAYLQEQKVLREKSYFDKAMEDWKTAADGE